MQRSELPNPGRAQPTGPPLTQRRQFLQTIAGAFTSATAIGCAGYRLGPTNGESAGHRSVEIQFFRNDTLEPRLGEAVVMALRRTVQQDGTYRLNSSGDADIVVSGVLLTYDRGPLSFQPRDVLTARDYDIQLHAKVIAVNRRTGETLFDRPVRSRTTLRAGEDFASAERQAVPLLAQDLARVITSLLVDGTW